MQRRTFRQLITALAAAALATGGALAAGVTPAAAETVILVHAPVPGTFLNWASPDVSAGICFVTITASGANGGDGAAITADGSVAASDDSGAGPMLRSRLVSRSAPTFAAP